MTVFIFACNSNNHQKKGAFPVVKPPLLQRRDKNQTLQPLSPLHLHRKATKKQLQLKSNQPPQNPQKKPLQQKKGGEGEIQTMT